MIWILLPAYNEEASLPKLLKKISDSMKEYGLQFQIVVVNDGSMDATAKILEEFSTHIPLIVISHKLNRGLGETERDGFEFVAEKCQPQDVIVRVEGDDTHDPKYIIGLLNKINDGYDVAITSRFQPGGGEMGLSKFRSALSKTANIFMHTFFFIPDVTDYSCGFRAYRGEVIQDAIKIFGDNLIQLRGLGFTSTLELIVKLKLMGCRFAEIPFILRYDQKEGASKMTGSITTLGYFIMALLYRLPFRGWATLFKGLDKLYKEDREAALLRYSNYHLRKTSS